jgi:hypothetical protein
VIGNKITLRGMVIGHGGPIYASEDGSALTPEIVGKQLAEKMVKGDAAH